MCKNKTFFEKKIKMGIYHPVLIEYLRNGRFYSKTAPKCYTFHCGSGTVLNENISNMTIIRIFLALQ